MSFRAIKFNSLTEEQIAMLRSYAGKKREEAANEFNDRFGCDVPLNTIKCWMKKLGIPATGTGRFDGTQKPWAKGLSKEEFWARYSEESKQRMIDAPRDANHTARVGDVHIKSGIPYICISDELGVPFDKRRAPLRRVVWQKHYGDIPEDHMIIHLNGNQLDCRIENLAMVPKRYRPAILRYMKSDHPDITRLAIRYCELDDEIRRKRGKL